MERIAIFPGSFDPFTIGHESIVRRAIPLFDKIIVAIGYNPHKQGFFPLEKRLKWINEVLNTMIRCVWIVIPDSPFIFAKSIMPIILYADCELQPILSMSVLLLR